VPIAFICVRSKILAGIGTQCHMGIAFYVKDFPIIVPVHNTEALSHICDRTRANGYVSNSHNPNVPDG